MVSGGKSLLGNLGRAALLASLICAGSCGAPETFQESSPDIVDVGASGAYLNFRAEMPYSGISGATVLSLARVVEAISQGLKDDLPGPLPETQWVKIDARYGDGEFKDRFGVYVFPIARLRSYGRGSVDVAILNLVESAEPGSGDTVEETLKWCAEQGALAQSASRFCETLFNAVAAES